VVSKIPSWSHNLAMVANPLTTTANVRAAAPVSGQRGRAGAEAALAKWEQDGHVAGEKSDRPSWFAQAKNLYAGIMQIFSVAAMGSFALAELANAKKNAEGETMMGGDGSKAAHAAFFAFGFSCYKLAYCWCFASGAFNSYGGPTRAPKPVDDAALLYAVALYKDTPAAVVVSNTAHRLLLEWTQDPVLIIPFLFSLLGTTQSLWQLHLH
jgi:hypothetical protein